MRYLTGDEKIGAWIFLEEAAYMAEGSTCMRRRCGSVIVNNSEIIGRGFNSPPGGLESQRRCSIEKDSLHKKITDKTCCMHAEERAIMSALGHNPNKLRGSTLYFADLVKKTPVPGKLRNIAIAGKPYCTLCSKMALDVGISEFVLLRKEGICVYTTKEYNDLSFGYKDS